MQVLAGLAAAAGQEVSPLLAFRASVARPASAIPANRISLSRMRVTRAA
jgi:hypothetical protein